MNKILIGIIFALTLGAVGYDTYRLYNKIQKQIRLKKHIGHRLPGQPVIEEKSNGK